MSAIMRIVPVLFFIAVTIAAMGYFLWNIPGGRSAGKKAATAALAEINTASLLNERLENVAAPVKRFTRAKGYNQRIAFLIDMSISSGRRRFFVYNMEKDSVEASGLVTHGQGSLKPEIEFSNIPGSYCTSLGNYKVGKPYNGRFGLAYKLYGLDKSNDKAFERFVVLHAHNCVPDQETDPYCICESQGCPTVSPAFLQALKKYIDSSSRPILMKIFKG